MSFIFFLHSNFIFEHTQIENTFWNFKVTRKKVLKGEMLIKELNLRLGPLYSIVSFYFNYIFVRLFTIDFVGRSTSTNLFIELSFFAQNCTFTCFQFIRTILSRLCVDVFFLLAISNYSMFLGQEAKNATVLVHFVY